jgi:hypothetical protein
MERRREVEDLAAALRSALMTDRESYYHGERANVPEALFEVARALHKLGIADAMTEMGALEALGLAVKEAGDAIGVGADGGGQAIATELGPMTDALGRIGRALERLVRGDSPAAMGVLEAHGMETRHAGEAIAEGLNNVAAAIDRVATALAQRGTEEG